MAVDVAAAGEELLEIETTKITNVFEASEPGEHVLLCRARDTAGNEQPAEPPWNLGGYVGNGVQRVPATVEDWVSVFKDKRAQIAEHRCPERPPR